MTFYHLDNPNQKIKRLPSFRSLKIRPREVLHMMDAIYDEIGALGPAQFKYILTISVLRAYASIQIYTYTFISQDDSLGIRSEWNLTESRSWMIPMTFTIQQLGGIGQPLVSRIGDDYGRKFAIMVYLLMEIVAHQVGGVTQR